MQRSGHTCPLKYDFKNTYINDVPVYVYFRFVSLLADVSKNVKYTNHTFTFRATFAILQNTS
jgi:hypothetical protein